MDKAEHLPFLSRLKALDRLLCETQWLWRPQPYKQRRPEWCAKMEALCEKLLSLTDEQVKQMGRDSKALVALLENDLPILNEIVVLTALPACEQEIVKDTGPHFHSGIPGRKWEQIKRLSASIGEVDRPLLEWCGGKGHLGRLLGKQWQRPVTTLEHDAKLCDDGEVLAKRSNVTQKFVKMDVLSPLSDELVKGRHAVALHACGELHRTLLRKSVKGKLSAFDFVPCCYYLGAGETYQPFSSGLSLELKRDDLRMAVTETVTAAGREVDLRDREMAWKQGYMLLRSDVTGNMQYKPVKPIQKRWLSLNFPEFCRKLAEREELSVPEICEWKRYEDWGWMRQKEIMRLNLIRAAFRRAIELWLVLDMASYISEQGYQVSLGTFCNRDLSPRNILISARS